MLSSHLPLRPSRPELSRIPKRPLLNLIHFSVVVGFFFSFSFFSPIYANDFVNVSLREELLNCQHKPVHWADVAEGIIMSA